MKDPDFAYQNSTWLLMSQDAKLREQGDNARSNGEGDATSNTPRTPQTPVSPQSAQDFGQRELQNYTLQLAILQEQDRQRRIDPANNRFLELRTQNAYSNSPTTLSPATRERFWTTATKDSPADDAVQQYQQMLLEEQRRRNRELGKKS